MLRKISNLCPCKIIKTPLSFTRALLLSLLAGVLLALPFSNGNLWIFAWFAFVPLFFALDNRSRKAVFLLSFCAGTSFWLASLYWLANVTVIGMLVFVLYLALYFGFSGLIFSYARRLPDLTFFLFLSSVWVVLEYIRAWLFTGFPWALLGYSQYLNLPIIQISYITGAWGVSFLVILVNLLIYKFACAEKKNNKAALCVLLLFLLGLCYGVGKLYIFRDKCIGSPLKISVIQGNIPQALKWDPSARDFIIARYEQLTTQALKENPDILIWPEAASPCYWGQDLQCFKRITRLAYENKIPLLLGTVVVKDNNYYNSALLLQDSPEKSPSIYSKIHLVPFGEYIPLRRMLPFLETVVPIGDFTPGKDYFVFGLQNPKYKISNKFSVLICFEDVFPGLSREFVKRGADFLVNITNDGWFGPTSSPYQHLAASVFRAVENGVPVVRAANTGVSAFIFPSGQIQSVFTRPGGRDIFVEGFLTQRVNVLHRERGFYTWHGDFFIFLLFIFIICSIFRVIYCAKAHK